MALLSRTTSVGGIDYPKSLVREIESKPLALADEIVTRCATAFTTMSQTPSAMTMLETRLAARGVSLNDLSQPETNEVLEAAAEDAIDTLLLYLGRPPPKSPVQVVIEGF